LICFPVSHFYIFVGGGLKSTAKLDADHRAGLATTAEQVKDRAKKSERRLYRRRTPGQHANLLQHLRNFDDSLVSTRLKP